MTKRDPEVVKKFLKTKGLKKAPKNKEVDHKKPLADGGKDKPNNLQILNKKEHKKKTIKENKARAKRHR